MKKILSIISLLPVFITAILGVYGAFLDYKKYDLDYEKYKKGDIPEKKIQILNYGATNLLNLLKSFTNSDFDLKIKDQRITSLYSSTFHIKNTGEAPILKSDFSENLSVKFPENWQILAFENKNMTPPEFKPIWKVIENNILQMEPLLINSGDEFSLEVFFSYDMNEIPKDVNVNKELEGTWSVRIANLKNIDFNMPLNRKDSKDTPKKSYIELMNDALGEYIKEINPDTYVLWKAGFYISPFAWGVWVILFIYSFIFFIYLKILWNLKIYDHLNKIQNIISLILLSVFCYAVADSFMTYFILLGRNVGIVNYFFIMLYVISIIYLKYFINRKSKAIN